MTNLKSRDRMYQVSSNRTSARHKVRYVESSAPPEGECRLCVGVLPERKSVHKEKPVESNPLQSSTGE
ncbi:hypothetical protein CWE15_04175 [Aliidiomarina taiwanensis]|uniref:Uncharacterized protein n=1 Tax=Aliidiomarina taiwanensis TaxID=946228 RepID=A0A432XAJ4_9GAMM|nr:hypothetical protein [Aliidiomarina taiwanensis]RUO44379.1 hypothetical protein CWE15_04175 [Aliidiomarina taiwanensis]